MRAQTRTRKHTHLYHSKLTAFNYACHLSSTCPADLEIDALLEQVKYEALGEETRLNEAASQSSLGKKQKSCEVVCVCVCCVLMRLALITRGDFATSIHDSFGPFAPYFEWCK